MAFLNLNTRVKFDKQYAWEALLNKYFDSTLGGINPKQEIKITMEDLEQISRECHEYGRLRERTLNVSVINPSP